MYILPLYAFGMSQKNHPKRSHAHTRTHTHTRTHLKRDQPCFELYVNANVNIERLFT